MNVSPRAPARVIPLKAAAKVTSDVGSDRGNLARIRCFASFAGLLLELRAAIWVTKRDEQRHQDAVIFNLRVGSRDHVSGPSGCGGPPEDAARGNGCRAWPAVAARTRRHFRITETRGKKECMVHKVYSVKAEWDGDAGVWVATSEDVPGLATEAGTFDGLVEKLRVMVPELLEANGILPPSEAASASFRVSAERVEHSRAVA